MASVLVVVERDTRADDVSVGANTHCISEDDALEGVLDCIDDTVDTEDATKGAQLFDCDACPRGVYGA